MMNNLPKKIIIGVFLVALFGELIWAMVYVSNKAKKKPLETITTQQNFQQNQQSEFEETQNQNNISGVTFSLNPSFGKIKIGQVFPVTIVINANNKTISGADAVLFYESDKLTPENEISIGTIFPEYPLIKINAEKEKISITGTMTNSGQQPFSGQGVFATIRFKAISEGSAKVKFDFTKGVTSDSNIVDKTTGKDLLERVINGSYTLIK